MSYAEAIEQSGATRQPLAIPVVGQLAVVNHMVLPLLQRTGIDVTVSTDRDGMTLKLVFVEPPEADFDELGTEDPDNAALLWALRDKIEAARAVQPS